MARQVRRALSARCPDGCQRYDRAVTASPPEVIEAALGQHHPEPPVNTIPGLDGVRALGIVLVLLFHGGVSWMGGGFFGVDVFFVLSGFLITGLLLAEFRRERTIELLRFWGHRIRRLVPALLALLAALCVYALLLAPADTVGQLRGDAFATMLYGNNWHLISQGQGYFAGLALPRPLLHTWSLSIEEQFYVVWPLVILGVLRLTRSRGLLLGIALVGAAASAVEMSLLFDGGRGLNRVYYGTDTRAQAVLVGAALAIALAQPLRSRRTAGAGEATHLVRPLALPTLVRQGLGLAGAAALVAVVVLAATTGEATTWVFHGGFALVAVLSAIVIASVSLAPETPVAALLSLQPVRYVGAISYGLYLWHWPLFVVLTHDRTGLSGPGLLALRLGATLAISALSFRFLELPIRRGALRGWRGWAAAPIGIGAVAAAVALVTAGAAPGIGSYASPKPSMAKLPIRYVDQGTTSNLPTVPAGTAGPVRLMLVGNSEATFLAFGLGPLSGAHDVAFGGDGVMGCGFIHAPTILHGHLELGLAGSRGAIDNLVPCATQEQRWAADLAAFNPDVVVVDNGAYEVRDHKIDGRWTHIGEPAFDALLRRTIERDVALLSSRGAKVVLLTAPYYRQVEAPDGSGWPEDETARVDAYNRMLHQVAAANPGTVVVLDQHRRLDPGNHFATTIDGVQARMSDGIHLTAEGARLLAPWMLDEVHRIGTADRAAG